MQLVGVAGAHRKGGTKPLCGYIMFSLDLAGLASSKRHAFQACVGGVVSDGQENIHEALLQYCCASAVRISQRRSVFPNFLNEPRISSNRCGATWSLFPGRIQEVRGETEEEVLKVLMQKGTR